MTQIRSYYSMLGRIALSLLVFAVLTAGHTESAHAQARPDAGALQQQIDRDRMQSLPPGGGLERPVPPPPALAS